MGEKKGKKKTTFVAAKDAHKRERLGEILEGSQVL